MIPKFRAWHKAMQRMSEVLAISYERQKVKIRHVRGTTHKIKRRIDGRWLLYPAWKDGQFWYLSPTEDGRETIEIIGDVYQNPDLVEGL